MIRRSVIASMILAAAVSGAYGQVDNSDMPRAKPPVLTGGVQQDQNAAADGATDPTTDANWELQARSSAAEREEAQAGAFMGKPLVFRVTTLGEIEKRGIQRILAMPIKQVTISSDGTVDLGQLIEGSGDQMEVPPGTFKVGDLFTRVANQYVKVPANHFDPMGSLADQVNKQLPMDSPTALNNLANQLANAADGYKNNAATFANDFLMAAGNVMGSTLEFLAQQRGDFGQPGKPMQDILNYLNNDNAENNAALGAAAQQAMQTLGTHPGTVAGNIFMAALPAGQLGKEAEIAQVTQATQRLTAMENAANDFANLERNLPGPKSDLAGLNLKQATDKVFPNGTSTPPNYRVPPDAAKQFPKQWGGPGVVSPGGVDPIGTPPGDTVRTPGSGGGTVPTRASGGDTAPPGTPLQPGNLPAPILPDPPSIPRGSPLQSRNIPSGNTRGMPQKAIPMTPQQRQALQDNLKKLLPALDQDAQWAGDKTVPAAAASRGDIINTLQSKYGGNSKDPLQGAPGLQESHFGIPTPATAATIHSALQTAGKNSQGLVFSQNPDNTLNVLNARNNDGQIEFLDPATEKRAQPPADSPLYFYRTR